MTAPIVHQSAVGTRRAAAIAPPTVITPTTASAADGLRCSYTTIETVTATAARKRPKSVTSTALCVRRQPGPAECLPGGMNSAGVAPELPHAPTGGATAGGVGVDGPGAGVGGAHPARAGGSGAGRSGAERGAAGAAVEKSGAGAATAPGTRAGRGRCTLRRGCARRPRARKTESRCRASRAKTCSGDSSTLLPIVRRCPAPAGTLAPSRAISRALRRSHRARSRTRSRDPGTVRRARGVAAAGGRRAHHPPPEHRRTRYAGRTGVICREIPPCVVVVGMPNFASPRCAKPEVGRRVSEAAHPRTRPLLDARQWGDPPGRPKTGRKRSENSVLHPPLRLADAWLSDYGGCGTSQVGWSRRSGPEPVGILPVGGRRKGTCAHGCCWFGVDDA